MCTNIYPFTYAFKYYDFSLNELSVMFIMVLYFLQMVRINSIFIELLNFAQHWWYKNANNLQKSF